MNPQINAILIGVKDIGTSKKFYGEGLGCAVKRDTPGFVDFDLGNGSTTLGLYVWDALAQDAGVAPEGSGFKGFTLNHLVDSRARVDEVMAAAKKAGAHILKPAEKVQWGGYSGTFSDPDGYVWKVATSAS